MLGLNVVCIEVLHTTFHGAGYFLLYKARICYFVKIYNNGIVSQMFYRNRQKKVMTHVPSNILVFGRKIKKG